MYGPDLVALGVILFAIGALVGMTIVWQAFAVYVKNCHKMICPHHGPENAERLRRRNADERANWYPKIKGRT